MSYRILQDPSEPEGLLEPEPDYWIGVQDFIEGEAGDEN
jgi:hypothetical protein